MERIGKRRGLAFSALSAAFSLLFVSCGEDKIVASGDFEVQRFADLPTCNAAYEGLLANVKSWGADYFCNGEIWVLLDEKPAECDSAGIMTDRRDGKTYRCADWGHGVWMVDNLNLGQFGDDSRASATIWPEARKSCEEGDTICPGGARYAYLTAVLIDTAYQGTNVLDMLGSPHRGLCPMGWHIPTKEEFLAAFGDDEALERQWPNTKDTTLARAFEVEVWTADGGGCRKGLSGTDDVSAKTEWGRARCESQSGSKRLRCVQD